MCRNEDAKNGNIDESDDDSGAPFELLNGRSVFGNDGDSVDDDLHKQLNLEYPEEQDEEECRHTLQSVN